VIVAGSGNDTIVGGFTADSNATAVCQGHWLWLVIVCLTTDLHDNVLVCASLVSRASFHIICFAHGLVPVKLIQLVRDPFHWVTVTCLDCAIRHFAIVGKVVKQGFIEFIAVS
jgi:hypothetical protein